MTVWLLIGFLAGYPIQVREIGSEQACRTLARNLAAGFGTGAQLHVECRAEHRPSRAVRVYE